MAKEGELTDEQRALVEANLGLAGAIVRQIGGTRLQWADREDCRSAAFLALCEAARSYQKERGKFGTYAGKAIGHAVRLELQARRLVRVPVWHGRPAAKDHPLVEQAQAQRPAALDPAVIPAKGPEPELELDPTRAEQLERVDAVLAEWPESRRRAIVVWAMNRHDDGNQIAAELGISNDAAWKRIRYNLRRLREALMGADGR